MLFLLWKEYRSPWGWGLHNYGTGRERALNGARAAFSAFRPPIPRKDGNSAAAVNRGYK